jgi:hypothetical protein
LGIGTQNSQGTEKKCPKIASNPSPLLRGDYDYIVTVLTITANSILRRQDPNRFIQRTFIVRAMGLEPTTPLMRRHTNDQHTRHRS